MCGADTNADDKSVSEDYKSLTRKPSNEGGDNLVEGSVRLGAKVTIGTNLVKEGFLCSLDVSEELLLELGDLGRVDFVQESPDTAVDDGHLVLNGHGDVLALLEQLSQSDTSVEELLSGGVKIRPELGESCDLSVLSQLELHGTGHLLHRLGLGSRSHTGHGQTDVDGGSDTFVEQLGLQEDLTVSDGDDIGGDVGRHVTSLGLDDGESSEGAAAHGVAHLGSSLQQTGVEVEDITGVSLTTRGTSQQKRHLSVGHGLLGQVVEDDDSVHAVVSEVLSHGHSGVGSEVLQGSGVRGSGRHNNRVLHSISVSKPLDNLGDGGSLLTNSHIDAEQLLLGISGIIEPLLVDDGIDGDSGFASLSVSNDQLTLATTNGHQAVDSLDASLHGLLDRLPGDDAGGLQSNPVPLLAADGALAVNGVTQGINDTSKDLVTNGDIHNGSGSLDNVSLLDELVITEHDNTNVVRFQVEGHALESRAELHHLLGLDVLETIDTSDTISNGEHTACLLKVDGGGGAEDSLLEDGGDLSSSSLGSINLLGRRELTCSNRDSWDLLCQLGSLGSLASEGSSHPS